MQHDPITNRPDLMASLVSDFIKEKRSDRRWRNIRFFLVFFLIVILFLMAIMQTNQPPLSEGEGKDYVALIYLEGMIGPGENFSGDAVVPLLESAFSDKDAKGVILDINSGGGTPVQASIIHDKILELKKKYNKKVIVVGEDMLASGAYFVAVAADKIYVNPNSITGSIGVVMKGFGFQELIKKIGVERRVYSSGQDKDRLDPFLPQNAEDIAKIQKVMAEVHNNFIHVVTEGRKGKLKADPAQLFSGDFWSGTSARELGLIDGVGNLSDVMRTEFNVSRYKNYSSPTPILRALMGQVGTSLNMMLNQTVVAPILEKI